MCFAVCIPAFAVPIELLPLQNEPTLAGDTDTAYEYPVIPGTKEWVDLGSTNARHMACEIPSEILTSLTTEALALSAFAYPFNSDIYVFNDPETGFQYVVEHSNAWSTLLEREDLEDTLLKLFASDLLDTKFCEYICLMVNHPSVYDRLSEAAKETLLSAAIPFVDPDPPEGAYLARDHMEKKTIYTPRTRLSVERYKPYYEWYIWKIAELDETYTNNYPSADFVSSSTYRYNCFSYALYWQSPDNQYTMPTATAYFDDSSYVRVSAPQEGDIAVYRDPRSGRIEHAGVVTWLTDEVRICSKWGRAPFMEHPVMECPYAALSVLYYRLYTK